MKSRMLPGEDWSLDVDLRYLPVARFLQRNGVGTTVLEVGSGSTGITPYNGGAVVGCDVAFPGDVAPRLLPVMAKGHLPFRDRSFDAVISLDTLEHVPREFRQLFVDEMFRIARTYVLVGFPEGDRAERHDAMMEAYFIRHNTEVHPYFVEHREYRIPRQEEVVQYFKNAGDKAGRGYLVRRSKNVNILLRSIFMRTVWNKNRSLQRIYTMLTALSRWHWLFHHGACYRIIYFITINPPVDGNKPL